MRRAGGAYIGARGVAMLGINLHRATQTVERQAWLDAPTEAVQNGLLTAFSAGGGVGRAIKNALHGVWFGHALHPAIVAIPIGAWSTALALDVMESRGRTDLRAGADTAVTYGLVGAAASALTGATDWTGTDGAARRVGAVHALLNYGVSALYLGSALQRRRGHRVAGRRLAYAGYALAAAAAYLGGHLVGVRGIGVSHAPEQLPDTYTAVLPERELTDATLCRVEASGTPVLLTREHGQLYALAEMCSHLGGPLSEGELRDGGVVCPWHGSRFALEDGRVLDGPASVPQPCLAVRIRDGQIEVAGASTAAPHQVEAAGTA